MRIGHVCREGQVLDGGPSGNPADLTDAEVRVTGGPGPQDWGDIGAHKSLARVSIHDLGICTVERVPVGIPVVGEPTAEAPRLRQLECAAIGDRGSAEHSIGDAGEAKALVSAGKTGAAIHCERRYS